MGIRPPTLPNLATPERFNYRAYVKRVADYNSRLHLTAMDAFNYFQLQNLDEETARRLEELHEKIALFTVGSDSRYEKHPQSKIDLVVVHNRHPHVFEAVHFVRRYVRSTMGRNLFNEHFETADLTRSMPLSYYRGLRHLVFPERILEGDILRGGYDLYEGAKRRVAQEIVESEDSERIIERAKRKKYWYRAATKSGTQKIHGQVVPQYDLGEGLSYYDPGNGQESFKQGPLRYVLNQFFAELFQYARNAGNTEILVHRSWGTMMGKLSNLREEGILKLTPEDLKILEDHYFYFLWLFHIAQHAYQTRGKTVTEFDRDEVSRRLDDLLKLTNEGIIQTVPK